MKRKSKFSGCPETVPNEVHPGRILKRRQLATLLNVCPQRVDQLSRAGVFRRVYLVPGCSRSSGYIYSEVLEVLTSKRAASAKAVGE